MSPPGAGDALERSLDGARGVLFLCSGNVVRSAFAELYARHLGLALPVESAATTFRNTRLFPETRAALTDRGLGREELDAFRSRHLDQLPERAPAELLVFGMTPEHLVAWRARHPDHPRTHLVLELLGRHEALADPVLEGADFAATYAQLERCVRELVRRAGA